MCRVIAVSNQKGGVGKTVSCVNLGIGLAQEGKKVLLIDADPQGSLTISLGYEEPDEMEYSLATLMMNIVNDEKLNIEKTILHHKEGVDLIPANIELYSQQRCKHQYYCAVDCILQILFSSYLISPYHSINYQLQKSEAFQSVHHVTFILCYTVL